MHILRRITLLFALICTFTFAVQAQNSIGLNIGLSTYEGDLHCFEEKGLSFINSSGLTFGLQGKRELSKMFNARLAYQFARFSGDDMAFSEATGHPSRGFDFINNMHEFTLRLDLEPWKQKLISPFISAGVGVALNNPNTFFDFENKTPSFQSLITEDQDNLERAILAVPLAIGANVRVSDLITIGAELGWRLGVSDYLDGVSMAGSSSYNDYFGTGAITLNYTLGKVAMKTPKVNVGGVKPTSPKVKKQPATTGSGAEKGDVNIDAQKKAAEKMAAEKAAAEKAAASKLKMEQEAAAKAAAAKVAADKAAKLEAEKIAAEEAAAAVDTDKDGIVDRLDACPNVYAKTTSGCPNSTVTSDINCSAIFAASVVNFQTSFAELPAADKVKLNAMVETMLACPAKRLVIEGHTDSRGSELPNQALSEKRANQVKAYFVSRGVPASRILAVGYGETRSAASNDTAAGRAQNRRVEIMYRN
ncbi:OmpA family protein [Saprospiraceae bacterium]|nr:OmpA family protein [Saprospiraceae bacterium]